MVYSGDVTAAQGCAEQFIGGRDYTLYANSMCDKRLIMVAFAYKNAQSECLARKKKGLGIRVVSIFDSFYSFVMPLRLLPP